MLDDEARGALARHRAAKAVNEGPDANLHVRSVSTAGDGLTRSRAAPPSRPGPTPGTPRREGRGFVDSYGQDRVCSAPGCLTRLSQYNGRSVCSLHDSAKRP